MLKPTCKPNRKGSSRALALLAVWGPVTVALVLSVANPAASQSSMRTFVAPRDLHGCLDLDTMKQWDDLASDKQAYTAFWLSHVAAEQCVTLNEGTPLTMVDAAIFDYEKVRPVGYTFELWVHSKGLP